MLVIAPLSEENWDALAALFSAGGDARWCWCHCTVGAQLECTMSPGVETHG